MKFALGLLSLLPPVLGQACVTVTHGGGGDNVNFPKVGDSVTMHYVGTLTNGVKFDSSRDRGRPFTTQIGVGQVIKGWDQGVPQLSLGETATLVISAACGYGAAGSPPTIPGGADLIFQVELLGINGKIKTTSTPAALPAAPLAAPPAPAALATTTSSSAATAVHPPGALPECVPDSCGRAINFERTGFGRPLCLCNPLCQEWASTPGILPCCPKLQEVCLDPWRPPTPAPLPPVQPRTPLPPVPVLPPAQPMNALPPAQSMNALPPAQPLTAFPPAQPMNAVPPALFQQTLALQSQSPVSALPVAAAVRQLPTCKPASCGMGMSGSATSREAICACDASCLVVGSILPCCNSFKEVCQAAQPVATDGMSTPRPAQTTASTGKAIAPAGKGKAVSPACVFGATKWEEQEDCVEKRYAIRNGKCAKVCNAVQGNPQYWPKTDAGKASCEYALAQCPPKPPKPAKNPKP